MSTRELKFRCWDRTDSCWVSHGYLECIEGGSLACLYHYDKPERFSITQYTGLEDVNSKRIYEGDFVTLRTIAHDYCTEVVFLAGCFAFKVLDPKGTLSLVFAHNISDGHFEAEVFGNKYEGDQPDPEVLGKYSPGIRLDRDKEPTEAQIKAYQDQNGKTYYGAREELRDLAYRETYGNQKSPNQNWGDFWRSM